MFEKSCKIFFFGGGGGGKAVAHCLGLYFSCIISYYDTDITDSFKELLSFNIVNMKKSEFFKHKEMMRTLVCENFLRR